MAELPNDATIEEVARVFGVEDRIGELTPAARRLTKGEMLAILGTEQTGEAVRLVATRSKPDAPTIELQAQEVGLDLTVQDIQSIESVFGTPSLPPNEQEAVRGEEELQNINLYCCCCPCCCATAVLDPARKTVA